MKFERGNDLNDNPPSFKSLTLMMKSKINHSEFVIEDCQ
jgi:hypothetical protein